MITLKAKSMEYSETEEFMARNSQKGTFAAVTMNPIGTTECGILSYPVTTLVAGNHFKGTDLNVILRVISLSTAACPRSHKCFLIRIT